MPFLIPLVAGIGSIVGGIGALKSGGTAAKASKAQAGILQQEKDQQAQEFAQMQSIFKTLTPFFEQYMGKGSPILNQVQTGAAENIAREYGGAEAQTAEKLGASGYGFTPSGATAGAFGDIEAAKAEAGTNTFLQNLLANEATKFQAAQGLSKIGESLKPGGTGVTQAQPSPVGQAVGQIGQGVAQIGANLPGKKVPNPIAGQGPFAPGAAGVDTAGTYNYPPLTDPSSTGFTPPGTMSFSGGTDTGG